ncbi:apolipoprotein A1/A4/E domain-containing protein [Rhizobium ruizarguesonis]|uniref:apolipoprotein A1/A4/E domain-containing protein n=1 Tax=Rhizobium ruizarguesonis TaxID=2081791 RepID=UPI0010309928|nr:apolipoprotein A1/A4/E domain-containing protein [Rhizobium ruizarguesonis]TBE18859.1 hypothetical protein ELH05_31415 [Rhizobium ruizarguesonis]WSH25275.1 apolipoprotein A1/A4/E domain-containing protein [Rhizobium ruizarguesonis]WSH37614.1 apolipoprotein A1/A4/E domain-containing protein [Rhizobium ruizarguesonis]
MVASRIALIALRAAPYRKTSQYHAVIIGTDDDAGKIWRYICYPLGAVKQMLSQVEEQRGRVQTNGDDEIDPFGESTRKKYGGFWIDSKEEEPPAEFPGGKLSAAERAEFRADSELELPELYVPLVMRDIVEVRFYRAGRSPFSSAPDAARECGCLARLDTCRPVDMTAPAGPPRLANDAVVSNPRYVGSMIELHALAKSIGDDRPRGKISGFRAMLDLRLASNAHINAPQDRPERSDTRGRIVVVAEGSGQRALWKLDDAGQPIAGDSALFDRIWMGTSINVHSDGRTGWARQHWDNKTLLDLADKTEPDRFKYPPPGKWDQVHEVPLLRRLKLLAPVTGIRRQFGFRVVAFDGPANTFTYPSLALRFELRSLSYSQHFSPAIESITPSGLTLTNNRDVYFAQEQRRGDINLPMAPDEPVRWLTTARLDFGSYNDGKEEPIAGVVLRSMRDLVRRLHSGLRAVRDGRPISTLPVPDMTDYAAEAVAWHAVGVLVDRFAHELDAPYTGSSIHSDAEFPFRFSALEPRAIDDMWHGANKAKKRLRASFDGDLPRLPSEQRVAPRYTFDLAAPRTVAGEASVDDSPLTYPAFQPAVSVLDPDDIPLGTRFELTARQLQGSIQAVSIGALRLVLDHESRKDMPFDGAGVVVLRRYTATEEMSAQDMLPGGIDAVIKLPILRADPADQDDPESAVRITARDRRLKPLNPQIPDPFSPLLIPLERPEPASRVNRADRRPAAKDTSQSFLMLTAIETATRHRDHTVGLSLRAITSEKDSIRSRRTKATDTPPAIQRLLVLDPRPLRVVVVEYQSLAASATSESSEIAVWNAAGEGGLSWRVRDDNETVRLTLPPQVIGEAMEKNRSDRPGKPMDVRKGTPAAARFGSLTVAQLDPTFADTRFREPGWNLRRLLGQATQRSPGARLRGLRLELLYGLLTRVRSPDLWYTEIAGAIGEPALPLFNVFDGTNPHLQRHSRLIDGVIAAERNRIAVDKLWKSRPDDDPILEDGVSFEIRLREIDHGDLRGPSTPLRWPVSGDVPGPNDTGGLIDATVLNETFKRSDDDKDSFPGGLAWAFESANILMSVYGKPRSDGGRVRGIHLSAYGGYGSQRALFDERKTIVETDTSQGRVHRYRLERMGRISCLWHRAKHVVVYERSVVPPALFYNAEPIGLLQDELLGRPVLRKVEEYVEILQPIRNYPEDGHSTRLCAFVVGAEFKSKKIRVDSDWGSDVRREGWRVPLWNRIFLGLSAAEPGQPENPDHPANLYPKPQIRLTLMGHDGVERPREIASPEKLYFYTSVIDGEGEDTDVWQTVRDVDFCDRPTPVVGAMNPTSADLTDAPLAPEPEYVPGYEPFTLDLDETDDAIALTHNRVPGGPSAVLRNVTIARGMPAAFPSNGSVDQRSNVKAFGDGLALSAANARNELDRAAGRVLGALENVDRRLSGDALRIEAHALADKAFAELDTDDLQRTITNVGDALTGVGKIPLTNMCAGLEASVRAQIDGQVSRFRIVARDLLNGAAATIEGQIGSCSQVVEADIAKFATVAQIADRMFKAVEDEAGTLPKSTADALKQTLESGVADVKALLDDLRTASDRVRKAAKLIDDLQIDIPAEIAGIRAQIKADSKALSGVIAGNAATITNELASIAAEAKTLLETLDQSLKEDVGDAKEIKEAKKELHDTLLTVDKLRSDLDRLAHSDLPASARRILIATARAFDDTTVWIRGVAEQADSDGTTLIAVIRGQLKDVSKKLAEVLDPVIGRIQLASDEAGSVLAELATKITDLLKPVDTVAAEITTRIERERAELVSALTEIAMEMDAAFNQAIDDLEVLRYKAAAEIDNFTNKVSTGLIKALQALKNSSADVLKTIDDAIGEARTKLRTSTNSTRVAATSAFESAKGQLTALVDQAAGAVSVPAQKLIDQLSATCQFLEGFAEQIANQGTEIGKWIAESLDLKKYKQNLQDRVSEVIDANVEKLDDLKREAAAQVHELTRNVENRARQLVGAVQESVRDITGASLEEWQSRSEGVYQKGDGALRALRALGDPPKTDRMGFNRPEVAYVLGEAKKLGVDMTPALALVNRVNDQIAATERAGKAVGDLLDSFGVRMPTSELTDRVMPQRLLNLSVADLLPHLGAIDFRGLLQRVGFPDLDDSEALKIRHGFDPATMTAWMEADIDVPFSKPAPLMEFGPVKIVIDVARLTAKARLAAGRDGTEKTMKGQIFGDWHVMCSGMKILTFRQTGLYFDQTGHIDFKVQPDRVELAEILQFLTQLIEATGQTGDFTVGPLMRGMIPAGVAAKLDLDLPDIQSGAFGIADLSIHILFGIAAIPEFEIFGELSVGSRLAPFTINVWILNGGGYLTQRLSFLPAARPRPLLTYTLDIGIVAGVGLGFSFGVVSGGVYLQLGCGIAFTWTTGRGGNTTTVRVFILVRGNVDVAGLVTVGIALLLEIAYDGANMIGAGELTISVKISVFYTLNVSQRAEYVFAGESKKGSGSQGEAYC